MIYSVRHDEAVSETIGVVLLISIVVVAVAIVGAILWSQPPPQKIPAFSASITNASCSVILAHSGGETVTNTTINILVDNADQTANFRKQGTASPWASWGIGETLVYAPLIPCILEPQRVDIIYTYGAGRSLLSSVYLENPPSGNFTPRPPVPPAIADFSSNTTSGLGPLAVQFTDTSTGPPLAWSWAFGDGGTSTLQNPSHTYSGVNSYTVSLTVDNGTGVGTNTKIKPNYITVYAPPLVANFISNVTTGNAPLTIPFIDISTGSPLTWNWTFGDTGAGNTSTLQNPSHTYAMHGRYTVNLTVTNASGGSNSRVRTNYIKVNPTPPWYNCSWSYRKNITIDHTRVSGTQYYFPVLINIASDPDLSASALGNGYDILFTLSDGTTKIPHEIESYTSSSGALVAWVNVPTITSTTDTTLFMYYGNATSANQQNKNGVWDANYKGAWHLNETGTGTRYDSTSNANNANTRNYDGDEAATGKIGGAQDLDGTNDYLESANNIGITANAVRTISFWVKLDTTGNQGMVTWGNAANNQKFGGLIFGANCYLWGWSSENDWNTGVAGQTGAWHHHAIVNDGTKGRWYVDGTELGTGFAHTYATADSHAFMGVGIDTATNYYMNGIIDEVRISNSARTAFWIQTEYNNQNSPSTFYSLGNQEQWTC